MSARPRAVLAAQAAATNYAGRRGVPRGETTGTLGGAGKSCTVVGYATIAYGEQPIVLVALDAPVGGSWPIGSQISPHQLTISGPVLATFVKQPVFFHVALGIEDLVLDDGTVL